MKTSIKYFTAVLLILGIAALLLNEGHNVVAKYMIFLGVLAAFYVVVDSARRRMDNKKDDK